MPPTATPEDDDDDFINMSYFQAARKATQTKRAQERSKRRARMDDIWAETKKQQDDVAAQAEAFKLQFKTYVESSDADFAETKQAFVEVISLLEKLHQAGDTLEERWEAGFCLCIEVIV